MMKKIFHQRIEKGIQDLNEKQNLKNAKGLSSFINYFLDLSLVKTISRSMKENFYFLSISLVVLCVTIIASQLNPDNNIEKK